MPRMGTHFFMVSVSYLHSSLHFSRASRLDAPPSCCRGGEESRPYNHTFISRKPRPVGGELHFSFNPLDPLCHASRRVTRRTAWPSVNFRSQATPLIASLVGHLVTTSKVEDSFSGSRDFRIPPIAFPPLRLARDFVKRTTLTKKSVCNI
jgi:hypothetical protein